uniref:hypothetical protein n=1 Tax=Roseiarcus sp. TaxID=1969460 RepID=UPI003F9BC420
ARPPLGRETDVAIDALRPNAQVALAFAFADAFDFGCALRRPDGEPTFCRGRPGRLAFIVPAGVDVNRSFSGPRF